MTMNDNLIYSSLRRLVLCSAALVAITACSQGPSSAPSATQSTRDVQGAVVKGPVRGATIEIFEIALDGQPIQPPIATAQTDEDGNFSVNGLPDIPLLARSRGGSFFDESDPSGQRRIALGAEQGFETILPAGSSTATVNPFTQALIDKLRQQSARDNVPMASLIDGGRALFIEAFGFDILTTIPANPTSPAAGSSPDQLNYAMALGGYANAVNSMITRRGLEQPRFGYIRALATDLSDGVQDSQASGDIAVAGQPLPPTVLNDEIRRFRNNNDAAYSGATPFEIDLSALSADASRSAVVNFEALSVSADENTEDLVLTLLVDPVASDSFTLRVRTLEDSATGDSDFAAFDQIITVPANQNSANIAIDFIDDNVFEADEEFRVVLSDVRGATLGADDEMIVVILNDDQAATPTPSPTPVITPTPSPKPSPTPVATPTPTPIVTPTPTVTTSPTPVITPTPTPVVTPTPTPPTLSVTTSGMVVENKSQARVQTVNLSASDPSATAPPVYTVPSPNTSGLNFFLPEDAANPATSFTQDDIDAGRVLLIPDPVVFEKVSADTRSITLEVTSDSGASALAMLPVDIDFESFLGDYHLLEFGIGMELRNNGTVAAPDLQGIISTHNILLDSGLNSIDGTLFWTRADDSNYQFYSVAQSASSDPGSSVDVSGDQHGLFFASESALFSFAAGQDIGSGQLDFRFSFDEILFAPQAQRDLPYTIRSLPLRDHGFVSAVRHARETYSTVNGSLYAADLQSHSQEVTQRVMIAKSDTADFFPLDGDYAFAGIHLELGVDSDGLSERYAGASLLETTISNNVATVLSESLTTFRRNTAGSTSPSTSPTCGPTGPTCNTLTFSVTTNGGVIVTDDTSGAERYGAIDENHTMIALVGHSLQSTLPGGVVSTSTKVTETTEGGNFTLSPHETSRHEFSVGVRRYSGTATSLETALSGRRFRIAGLEYAAGQFSQEEAIGEMRHGELVFGTGGSVELITSAENTPPVICPSTPAGLLPVATTVARRTNELAQLEQPSQVEEHCDSFDANSAAHYEGIGSTVTFGTGGQISFSIGDHHYSGFVSNDATMLVLQAKYDGLSIGNHLSGAPSESGVALLIGTRDFGFNLDDIPPQKDVDNSCGGSLLITDGGTKRLLRNGGAAEFQENNVVAPGSSILMESCFENLDLDLGTVTEIKQSGGVYPTALSAAWEATIPDSSFSDPSQDETTWMAPTANSGRSFLNAVAKNGVFESVLSAIIAFGEDCDSDGQVDDFEDGDLSSCL